MERGGGSVRNTREITGNNISNVGDGYVLSIDELHYIILVIHVRRRCDLMRGQGRRCSFVVLCAGDTTGIYIHAGHQTPGWIYNTGRNKLNTFLL